MDYLKNAAQEVFNVVLSSPAPSGADLERAFTVACSTLSRLADDEQFFGSFDLLSTRRSSNESAFQEIIRESPRRELDHFLQNFQCIERAVLQAAGVSEDVIESCLAKLEQLRNLLDNASLRKAQLRYAVLSFQREACSVAQTLGFLRIDEEERKRQRLKLERIAYAIGGGVLIFVNASPLAARVGLSPAGSAVSGAAGTVLITYGLTPVSSKP